MLAKIIPINPHQSPLAINRTSPENSIKALCIDIVQLFATKVRVFSDLLQKVVFSINMNMMKEYEKSFVLKTARIYMALYTPQKMFLLAFSFANFETTRGNTGEANISFLSLLSS